MIKRFQRISTSPKLMYSLQSLSLFIRALCQHRNSFLSRKRQFHFAAYSCKNCFSGHFPHIQYFHIIGVTLWQFQISLCSAVSSIISQISILPAVSGINTGIFR